MATSRHTPREATPHTPCTCAYPGTQELAEAQRLAAELQSRNKAAGEPPSEATDLIAEGHAAVDKAQEAQHEMDDNPDSLDVGAHLTHTVPTTTTT